MGQAPKLCAKRRRFSVVFPEENGKCKDTNPRRRKHKWKRSCYFTGNTEAVELTSPLKKWNKGKENKTLQNAESSDLLLFFFFVPVCFIGNFPRFWRDRISTVWVMKLRLIYCYLRAVGPRARAEAKTSQVKLVLESSLWQWHTEYSSWARPVYCFR